MTPTRKVIITIGKNTQNLIFGSNKISAIFLGLPWPNRVKFLKPMGGDTNVMREPRLTLFTCNQWGQDKNVSVLSVTTTINNYDTGLDDVKKYIVVILKSNGKLSRRTIKMQLKNVW